MKHWRDHTPAEKRELALRALGDACGGPGGQFVDAIVVMGRIAEALGTYGTQAPSPVGVGRVLSRAAEDGAGVERRFSQWLASWEYRLIPVRAYGDSLEGS